MCVTGENERLVSQPQKAVLVKADCACRQGSRQHFTCHDDLRVQDIDKPLFDCSSLAPVKWGPL